MEGCLDDKFREHLEAMCWRSFPRPLNIPLTWKPPADSYVSKTEMLNGDLWGYICFHGLHNLTNTFLHVSEEAWITDHLVFVGAKQHTWEKVGMGGKILQREPNDASLNK